MNDINITEYVEKPVVVVAYQSILGMSISKGTMSLYCTVGLHGRALVQMLCGDMYVRE